jgi:hypothetical protein
LFAVFGNLLFGISASGGPISLITFSVLFLSLVGFWLIAQVKRMPDARQQYSRLVFETAFYTVTTGWLLAALLILFGEQMSIESHLGDALPMPLLVLIVWGPAFPLLLLHYSGRKQLGRWTAFIRRKEKHLR